MANSRGFKSVGEIARKEGAQAWHIQRLYEQGVFPEPPRLAGRRMIEVEMIPLIRAELLRRGWIKEDLASAD